MRASTTALIGAVQALTAAVSSSIAEINEYVGHMQAAHDDGDDKAVTEAADAIKALTAKLTSAVDLSNSAVETLPSDSSPPTGPVADPATGTGDANPPQA